MSKWSARMRPTSEKTTTWSDIFIYARCRITTKFSSTGFYSTTLPWSTRQWFDNHYCWIVYFRNNVIARVRAYLDSAMVARLFEENSMF